MTDQEKLDALIAKRELLETQKEVHEAEVCVLEEQIEDLEYEERMNPINVARRQAEWDALSEEQKRVVRVFQASMAETVREMLKPMPISYTTRSLGNWIAPTTEDPNIPVSGR